jgi:opacity protein-like surface antigen
MTRIPSARTAGLALLAAVALLPATAFAQGFYGGIDAGRGRVGLECAAGSRCDNVASATGFRLGYRFTLRWGVEVGILGVLETNGTLDRGLGPERGRLRVGAALYQGTGTVERGPWSVTAKLGIADNVARSSFDDYPTRDRTGVTATAGLEVAYRLSTHWRISVSDQFRPNVSLTQRTHGSVNTFMAGLTYGAAP